MPTFTYRARGADGSVSSGVIDAPEMRRARDQLRAKGLAQIIELAEQTPGFFEAIKDRFETVKTRELMLFTIQLADLVGATVPIVKGLATLEEQAESKPLKKVLGLVRSDIEGGLSISEALKKHRNVFPESYTSLVKAGELSGKLDEVLLRLGLDMEKGEALTGKVKETLRMPIITLCFAILTAIFLVMVVVPGFATTIKSLGLHTEMPLPTEVLLWTSDFLKHYLFLVFGAAGGLWWGYGRFYKTTYGRHLIDPLILRLPVFGKIVWMVDIVRFSQTLGMLLKSGVAILEALETVAAAVQNVVISDAVLAARQAIQQGRRLSDPLKKSGVFPPIVINMISIGEETGNLEHMLAKIAESYEKLVDREVAALPAYIEPMALALIGSIVLTILLAMYLPMFKVYKEMGTMG